MAGRDFEDSDIAQPRRVIINETVAHQYFAGREAIGGHVWLENERDPYEVVGIAGDAKYHEVRDPAPPTVYLFAPMSRESTLSLRTSVRPTAIATDARRIVDAVFGSGSVRRMTTLAEQVDAAIVPERLMASLAGFFGGAGALLAAIGLYGLLAYTVTRRTREIGIRMALGATRVNVMGMVLRNALWLVGAGLVIGAPVALWSNRIAASMLENLSSGGVLPIAVAVVAMIPVALRAAYIPARRATQVEPLSALRSE